MTEHIVEDAHLTSLFDLQELSQLESKLTDRQRAMGKEPDKIWHF